jgi:hypothetical protein
MLRNAKVRSSWGNQHQSARYHQESSRHGTGGERIKGVPFDVADDFRIVALIRQVHERYSQAASDALFVQSIAATTATVRTVPPLMNERVVKSGYLIDYLNEHQLHGGYGLSLIDLRRSLRSK